MKHMADSNRAWILTLLSVWIICCRAFVPRRMHHRSTHSPVMAAKTTLNEETAWTLRFVLRGVTTTKGRKVNDILSIQCHFLEEEGYEPPQGTLRQIQRPEDRLVITKSYWKLSEDPNQRKDGLWVWGLFKEPLYPYLLLNLETAAISLASAVNDENADSIQPLQVYAQVDHKRHLEKGVILNASDLKVRQVETVKADPFGAAEVDLYNEVSIGTLSIQAVTTTAA